jgi:hypothetical protein
MVETIIRRWRCHFGWNKLASFGQVVIAIRQDYSFHWLTILSITAKMSVLITEIGVDIVSQDGTRQGKQGNCGHQRFHFVGPGLADPPVIMAASTAPRLWSPDRNISRSANVSAKRTITISAIAAWAANPQWLSDGSPAILRLAWLALKLRCMVWPSRYAHFPTHQQRT